MIELFKKKHTGLLGLDISSTSVKLLELSRSGETYRVESYGYELLPEGVVMENAITNIEAVAAAIRRAYVKSRSKSKYVAVAVAGSSVITKTVNASSLLSEDEMESQIQIDADQYIPYPLDEVEIDFEIQGLAEGKENEVEVLLAACRKETVEQREDATEIADLTTKVVDIESYAILRAFELIKDQLENMKERSLVAIVDIGSTVTTLNVVQYDKIIYTREQMFGGKQLTEDIQRRYGLSTEEANVAKKQGGLPEGYEQELLEPFKEQAIQQVSRALQFFFSSGHVDSVDYIVLAGGCASIPRLRDMVEKKLQTKTIVANPFEFMSVNGRVHASLLANDAPSLLIACGLAMRSFD